MTRQHLQVKLTIVQISCVNAERSEPSRAELSRAGGCCSEMCNKLMKCVQLPSDLAFFHPLVEWHGAAAGSPHSPPACCSTRLLPRSLCRFLAAAWHRLPGASHGNKPHCRFLLVVNVFHRIRLLAVNHARLQTRQ